MPTSLAILLGIVSALLILVILLQNRSTGLSATFGGAGSFQSTKRGAEKVLAQMTVVLAVLFLILAFIAPLWNPLVTYLRSKNPVVPAATPSAVVTIPPSSSQPVSSVPPRPVSVPSSSR